MGPCFVQDTNAQLGSVVSHFQCAVCVCLLLCRRLRSRRGVARQATWQLGRQHSWHAQQPTVQQHVARKRQRQPAAEPGLAECSVSRSELLQGLPERHEEVKGRGSRAATVE
jgi:hypothetical protein